MVKRLSRSHDIQGLFSTPFSAVKILVVANNCEISSFRHHVLVRIIKIQAKSLCYLHNTACAFRLEVHKHNTTIDKNIPNEVQELSAFLRRIIMMATEWKEKSLTKR